MATNVICPRCAYETIEQLYDSPVPDAWKVLQCQQCLYCWRTSEPARRTDRDAYPDEFKMTVEDILNAPEVPAIPPLLAKTGRDRDIPKQPRVEDPRHPQHTKAHN